MNSDPKEQRLHCTYSRWPLDTTVNYFKPYQTVRTQFPNNHGHTVRHSPPIGPTPQALLVAPPMTPTAPTSLNFFTLITMWRSALCNFLFSAWFQASTAVHMRSSLFCDVTQGWLVDGHRRSETSCGSHRQWTASPLCLGSIRCIERSATNHQLT